MEEGNIFSLCVSPQGGTPSTPHNTSIHWCNVLSEGIPVPGSMSLLGVLQSQMGVPQSQTGGTHCSKDERGTQWLGQDEVPPPRQKKMG